MFEMINQDIKEIIIILIVILIIYHFYLTYNVCSGSDSIEIYEFQSENYKTGDKTILIIGGTHGNEPAGYLAIKKFMQNLNLNRIKLNSCKLILIPQVNYCALKLGIRFIPEIGDLNRKYPTTSDGKSSNNIIKQIQNKISEADFVLDFHEGWGFNRLNEDSMGSTITPTNTKKSFDLARDLFSNINKNLNGHNRFRILTTNSDLVKSNPDIYAAETDIKGSLRYYCNIINKDYILIETTGQNNIQPINVRVEQNLFIINHILKFNIVN
jgi:hypothetical protein